MSTRRARIKAVATLPVRRRNLENSEQAKIELKTEISESPTKKIIEENSGQDSNAEIVCSPQDNNPAKNLNPEKDVNSTKDLHTAKDLNLTQEVSATHVVHLTHDVKVPSNKVPQINSSKQPPKQPEPSKSGIKVLSNKVITSPSEIFKSPVSLWMHTHSPGSKTAQPNAKKHSLPLTNTSGSTSILNAPKTVSDQCDSQVSTFDGIVPLSSRIVHIEEDKNLNFESAEVSFDPIVPLPSPSPGKLRQKLKPIPRFGLMRRNSVQGSASESEEESRKQHCATPVTLQAPLTPQPQSIERPRLDSGASAAQSTLRDSTNHNERVRNDSVCSSVSVGGISCNAPTTPFKDKHLLSRSKRTEHRNRVSVLKRRLKRGVSRDRLTMYDLIFYNPTTNPIVRDNDEDIEKIMESKKKEELSCKSEMKNEAPSCKSEENSNVDMESVDDGEDECTPAVQIKLAPDGSIVVDETSTVITTTEMKKRKLSETVVHETEFTGVGRGRYTKNARAADWSDAETVRFYRALAVVGTDFSLMLSLFPNRPRRDLKIKFKKEERNNGAQVDKALTSKANFDIEELMEEFETERNEEKRRREEAAEARKRDIEEKARLSKLKSKRKIGKAAKTLLSLPEPLKTMTYTSDELIDLHKEVPRPRNARPSTVGVPAPPVPHNLAGKKVEPGSLVVLSIASPQDPTKKMLQTYVAGPDGRLRPVALPNSLLNPVINYMSNSRSSSQSPQTPSSPFKSPSNIRRTPATPIQHNMADHRSQGKRIGNGPTLSLPFNNMTSPNVDKTFAQPSPVENSRTSSDVLSSPGFLNHPGAIEGLVQPEPAVLGTPPSARRRRNDSFTITQLP